MQYIDNSSNCIRVTIKDSLKMYTKSNMRLLQEYYKANPLRMISKRATFMVISIYFTFNRRQRFSMHPNNGEMITDDLSIIILGWWIMSDQKLIHHVSKIRAPVYLALSKLRPSLKHMNLKQRRAIVYAEVLGIASYGL